MAVGMLAFMNVVWGAQFPFTKPALEVIPSFTLYGAYHKKHNRYRPLKGYLQIPTSQGLGAILDEKVLADHAWPNQ